MSIAGIASNVLFQPPSLQNNHSQQFPTKFQQLGKDLQAGNIVSAQQDFATLQQDLQRGASLVQHHHHRFPNVEQPQNSAGQLQNPIAQASSSLGQDLQSGDLSAARQAFATIQQELQQLGGVSATSNTTAGSINLAA